MAFFPCAGECEKKCSDDKKVSESVVNETEKESKHTQEAGATVEATKIEMRKATIDIEIEDRNDKPRKNKTFQQEPGPFLMKECDEKSKEIRGKLTDDYEEKTPHVGSATPVHNGGLKDKAVCALIREIDAQRHEVECLKSKMPEYWNWIYMGARNTFHEGVGAGVLKCVTGHNHHGCRNRKINNILVGSR